MDYTLRQLRGAFGAGRARERQTLAALMQYIEELERDRLILLNHQADEDQRLPLSFASLFRGFCSADVRRALADAAALQSADEWK